MIKPINEYDNNILSISDRFIDIIKEYVNSAINTLTE